MTEPHAAQGHPYIPNALPDVQAEMLAEIGANSIDELYGDIPEELRFRGTMRLPAPLVAEAALRRHVEGILNRNQSCREAISFLGGGSARHFVPAVCDEINHRAEFVSAYAGEPYEDHGRFQALFEYASLMGELLDLDVVNIPTYDWNQAASTALRMAGRITGRRQALVSSITGPDRLSTMRNYCQSALELAPVAFDPATGLLGLDDLQRQLSSEIACVYFENPSYLGCIEHRGQEIADLAHRHGALCIVGVDPISLGVLAPPSQYGADITCGDLQPLGLHMNQGGALAGFIATRDEERFVREYPSRLFGLTATTVPGEWGFGDVLYDDRTSFGAREKGKEYVGTAAALWGITAGVYLASMGPAGMQQVGQTILQKSQYTAKKLSELRGVSLPFGGTAHFKEFVVDFRGTGLAVARINRALLEKGVFGGIDLTGRFPGLDGCALYCVTEMHTQEDIDTLVHVLQDILAERAPTCWPIRTAASVSIKPNGTSRSSCS
jgi:glycine dehydrogenase subunit 1